MSSPETTPVIIGVGEYIDRPEDATKALEPIKLMAKAIQAADADGGGKLLNQIDSIDLVGLVSWRYMDPVNELCDLLGVHPARRVNATMGGETPIRLIHEAALRVMRGESKVCVITGGEAQYALSHARKAKARLDWTPMADKDAAQRFGGSSVTLSGVSKALNMRDPAQVYPLYEMAYQAAHGQTPAEGDTENAALWAKYSAVAATNPYAWTRSAPDAETIATVTPDNRMINWPYRKFMVANPNVNQASAVIVTSLAKARADGVDEARLIHIWGGGAAKESDDYLHRDRYDHSTAQKAVLDAAVEVVGGDPKRFDKMELYSCFPVVPKMALRSLGLEGSDITPTVTGGIPFFGGPLNEYMNHAACAMVRELRAHPGEIGLLYGNGGFVSKHHTLVVSTTPAPKPLTPDYSVQAKAEAARLPAPELDERYSGPAVVETYTVRFARDGDPLDGIVVARTPEGGRVLARVPTDDEATMALLLSTAKSAVGVEGHVRVDVYGKQVWEAGAKRSRANVKRHSSLVEKDGHVTIVTINRPEVMNALTPMANGELAEIFDDFAADPDQWIAILTGAGDKAFSAGNDLKHTAKIMARGQMNEQPLTGFAGLTSRYDLDKPVIAAVNGLAMGGGFEIALACDIIVASEDAVFALPEPRVGLAALAGGLHRLPREIGLKRAMSMILTARRVPAREGVELGFVNEAVPADKVMETAKRWAAEIAALSPMSIRASKQVAMRGLDEPTLADAMNQQNRYPAARALYRSADFREGPLAFSQKRPPKWVGR